MSDYMLGGVTAFFNKGKVWPGAPKAVWDRKGHIHFTLAPRVEEA